MLQKLCYLLFDPVYFLPPEIILAIKVAVYVHTYWTVSPPIQNKKKIGYDYEIPHGIGDAGGDQNGQLMGGANLTQRIGQNERS